MRVLLIGYAGIENIQEVLAAARQESGFPITEIVAGNLTDFDDEVLKFCATHKHHLRICFASKGCWGDSKTAVYKRNQHMIESSDALIAIWNGQDESVRRMVEAAQATKRMRVHVKFVMPVIKMSEEVEKVGA